MPVRYSPLSIPLPLIVLTAGVGIVSGYYILNDIVISAVDKTLIDNTDRPPAVIPHLRRPSPPVPTSPDSTRG
jgi:hypothetical protein